MFGEEKKNDVNDKKETQTPNTQTKTKLSQTEGNKHFFFFLIKKEEKKNR